MNIAVLDLETDPFEYGKMVQPFVAGFYDGQSINTFWSKDCVSRLVADLQTKRESYTIYAHNGGRFDFFYFMPFIQGATRIVNGRIIQAQMGKHQLRDSYAIMPFPLADYDKDAIDYEKMRADVREQHRDEILKYLGKDLTSLYKLVTAFHREFGDKLTIGSASMKQIKTFHKFTCGNEIYDAKFRSDFYFGGRNQVFVPGVTRGDIRVYDVNSMYPYVMQSHVHPIGTGHTVSKSVDNNTVFVVAEGKNYGAFPTREKNGSLNFTRESGIFHTTVHEWYAALETGRFHPNRILKTYSWRNLGNFDEFVSHFYDARRTAKKHGDKIKTLFYKYVLNSGYGKFAQNPDNYYDWYITVAGEHPPEWHVCSKSCQLVESNGVMICPAIWEPSYRHDDYLVWKRPLQTRNHSWYNIATGASITGAARAVLLRGIHATDKPLYCDTDSIICCGNSRVPVDTTRLGAWDLEATGGMVAIAGKKLYALFDGENTRSQKQHICDTKSGACPICGCIKKAHKGARLSGSEIVQIVRGGEIVSRNPVPAFRWDGTYGFTKRRIRRTV